MTRKPWMPNVSEAAEGEILTERAWDIPVDWRHMRPQVEDAQGRRARMDPLFIGSPDEGPQP